MAKLSVTIITRNEERDLPACLDSVAFADEIVVVDSGSIDSTREIAAKAGAIVIENPWPGFAAQKNFALAHATNDWVLSLDADERCSPPLQEIIKQALLNNEIAGYQIPFETYLFGRRAKFGGLQGEHHLRLFRRSLTHFPECAIHEGAQVKGQLAKLNAPIIHFTYDSLEEYLEKFNQYTTNAAKERFQERKRFSAWLAAMRLPWGFLRRYLFKFGFLDGYIGFLHASLSAFYDFVKVAKVEELERRQDFSMNDLNDLNLKDLK